MKKLLTVFISSLLILGALPAYAAIVRDNTAPLNGPTTGTSATLTGFKTTGSNLLLVVNVTITGSNSDLVTGVTYGGVAMTRINTEPSSDTIRSYLYYILPSAQTSDIVVTTSSSVSIYIRAVSYTGVKQSGQPDAQTVNATPSGTSLANTLTTVADNSIHLAAYDNNAGGTASVTNATAVVVNASNWGLYESNPLAITPAGSNTMTVSTGGVTNAINSVGASFSPATTPTTKSGDAMRMGMGF